MLIVFYGKSGSGKSTIVKELCRKYGYERAISETSRPMRKGEVNGIHYIFKTKEEILKDKEDYELAEVTEYLGNYYGLPVRYINSDDVYLAVMEPQGIKKLISKYSNVYPIYVDISDASRTEFLQNDLSRFPEETEKRIEYDNKIFTDDVQQMAYKTIKNSISYRLPDIVMTAHNVIKCIVDDIQHYEIERRWIVPNDDAFYRLIDLGGDKVSSQLITQFMIDDVRYRKVTYDMQDRPYHERYLYYKQTKTNPYSNNYKNGKVKIERTEIINTEEYIDALSKINVPITKTRFMIPYNSNIGKVTIELDKYTGIELKGCMIAEIEFDSIKDAKNFNGSAIGLIDSLEVTNDLSFSNKEFFKKINEDNGCSANDWIMKKIDTYVKGDTV